MAVYVPRLKYSHDVPSWQAMVDQIACGAAAVLLGIAAWCPGSTVHRLMAAAAALLHTLALMAHSTPQWSMWVQQHRSISVSLLR